MVWRWKILILFMTVLAVSGCAGEKESVKGTIRGTIYVIGHEPFTSLAVEALPGKMYRIASSKEIQGRLLKLQGKIVELQYTKIDSTPEGVTLSVRDFKEISWPQ